jgi:hypothetical protein
MGLTTDPNDPCLNAGQKEEGQNNCYLVLSEEERGKGFVRPYRDAYVHKGRLYKDGINVLDSPYESDYNGKTYVATANVIKGDDGKWIGATYLTKEELDQYNRTGGYVGGCGTLTIMGRALSETYARQPNFYGATFCCGCNKHLPVGEFVWDKDGEILGS